MKILAKMFIILQNGKDLDVRKAWHIKEEIIINDQLHMNKIINKPSYILAIHTCICFLYNWDKTIIAMRMRVNFIINIIKNK
jgi:hypothetical protein